MTNAELSETYLVSDLALVSEANFALPLLLPALIWIRLASGRLTGIVTLSKPLSSSAEILSASAPSGRTTQQTKLALLSRLYSSFCRLCALAYRELLEETGIKANISKILFIQEFNSKNNKIIEIIWLATPKDHLDNILEIKQTDTDPESEIEQVKWFDFTDLNKIEVKPNQLLELIKNQEITYIKS